MVARDHRPCASPAPGGSRAGAARVPLQARTAVVVALLVAGFALLQPIYAQSRGMRQAANAKGGKPNTKASQPPKHTWHRPSVLLFGDSLTELAASPDGGWAVLLTDRYKRRADVINRGFGGYTSKQAVEILPEITQTVDLKKTALAIVWFGANDAAATDGPQSYMSVPVDHFTQNLKKIVTDLKDAGVWNVMLVTPPPVDDGKRAASTPGYPPDRKFEVAKQYANAVVKAGQETNVPVLNVFEQFQLWAPDKTWSSRFLQSDGLHLSPNGQKTFYKMLNDFIWTNFQNARPDELAFHHPSWEGLDHAKSAAQFREEQSQAKRRNA